MGGPATEDLKQFCYEREKCKGRTNHPDAERGQSYRCCEHEDKSEYRVADFIGMALEYVIDAKRIGVEQGNGNKTCEPD